MGTRGITTRRKAHPNPINTELAVAAGEQIADGELIIVNASGMAVEGAQETTGKGVVVAAGTADNSGGGDGDETIRVESGGIWLYSIVESVDRSNIGDTVYVNANAQLTTAAEGPTPASNQAVGTIFEIKSPSRIFVKVNVLGD